MRSSIRILVVASTVGITFGSHSHASNLTFEDRVAAQKAIEQVYWNHRIWPNENPGPKPPLSAVMPDAAIRAKVEDYLTMTTLLDGYWHQPLTGAQIQSEIDRMVGQTKAPETLQGLFAALHDDPVLIAECLARPALAHRRVAEAFAADERIHGAQREALVSRLAGLSDALAFEHLDGDHAKVRLVVDDDVDANSVPADSSPDEIHLTRADWNRRIGDLVGHFKLDARLRPGLDVVASGPEASAELVSALPVGRVSRLVDREGRFTAFVVREKSATSVTIASVSWAKRNFGVWKREAIGSAPLDAAAIGPPARGYSTPALPLVDCVNDTWTPTAASNGRYQQSSVWTGAEMIVWGGSDHGEYFNTGGRYNPATDSWAVSSLATGSGANVPSARDLHTAVWTGTEMIVWGGQGPAGNLSTGGRYNPSTDAWAVSSLAVGAGANLPTGRRQHTAVWTGTEMIVWGGFYNDGVDHYTNTGGRFNPLTDSWVASSLTTASGASVPAGRTYHTAVWAGTEMIVWGGYYDDGAGHYLNTGGRYDPLTDSWAASSLTTGSGANVPTGRRIHTAVWTGTEMIVWGGYNGTYLNSGGRYSPSTDSWAASSLTTGTGSNVPTGRYFHTAVWSAERGEMIVWGGAGSVEVNTGGRYNPSTDSWAASSLTTGSGANVPAGRAIATAVWTGTEMIVWGGTPIAASSNALGTGGRYDPSTDTWAAMSVASGSPANVPFGSYLHSAIWTGAEMIVWGGDDGSFVFATGSRYDPATDSWVTSSLNSGSGANRPSPSSGHTAVWTGTEMIVWGGWAQAYLKTGGRYNPATDTWTASSLTAGSGANVPTGRRIHTAVWTGTEMIVWGGSNGTYLNSGGRYKPSTDTWAASSLTTGTGANVPTGRYFHTAIWSAERGEMIVWGGYYNDGTDHTLKTGGRYNPSIDTWAASSLTAGTGANVPAGVFRHTAVWTGTEMIVWGGSYFDGPIHYLRTGGRYNPAADAWAATSLTTGSGLNVPEARNNHTARWTGSEMIVWGGFFRLVDSTGQYLDTGGRYNPSTDLWAAASLTSGSGANVPAPREGHTAVWTGSQLIVWGGNSGDSGRLHTGGLYCACPSGTIVYRDADGDGYGNLAVTAASCDGSIPSGYVADRTDCNDASAAVHPGAVEVCNGLDDNCDGEINEGVWISFYRDADGDGYGSPFLRVQACLPDPGWVTNDGDCDDANPAIHPGTIEACNGLDDNCSGQIDEGYSNSTGWNATTMMGAPTARSGQVGVSTGSLAIVWGGSFGIGFTNLGSRYDPLADTWTATSVIGVPNPRRDATAVWTGSQMIVWGGEITGMGGLSNSGARYNPSNDTWSTMSNLSGGSNSRTLHAAVWAGSKMIVWGGKGSGGALGGGAIWDQGSDLWSSTATVGAPSPRYSHTAVWTGAKMIVWGGENTSGTVFGDGAIYDLGTNSWSSMSSSGAPAPRTKHTAVWTGTQMIVWGGWNNSGAFFADGAAYDPATNTWTPLTSSGAPSARGSHTAVWDQADGLMIVWGGRTTAGSGLNDGAAYNLSTNTWSTLSNTNAPVGRSGQAAVWMPSLRGMVVWGGDGSASTLDTGGRYVLTSTNCGVGGCMRSSAFACQLGPVVYTCTPGPSHQESCNGIDDNCDGPIDNGIPVPGALVTLTMTKHIAGSADLLWILFVEAQSYDTVRGSLNTLRSSAGDYTISTDSCLSNDAVSSPVTDAAVPAAGSGFWYLVRASNCAGAGSYNVPTPGQVGSRDAEIAASPNACP